MRVWVFGSSETSTERERESERACMTMGIAQPYAYACARTESAAIPSVSTILSVAVTLRERDDGAWNSLMWPCEEGQKTV